MKKILSILLLSLLVVGVSGCANVPEYTPSASSYTPTSQSTVNSPATLKSTPTQKATPSITVSPTSLSIPAGDGYINSQGNKVPSPQYFESAPAGATAECGDGTYSFSQSRRGTCSHHGGVSRWL